MNAGRELLTGGLEIFATVDTVVLSCYEEQCAAGREQYTGGLESESTVDTVV